MKLPTADTCVGVVTSDKSDSKEETQALAQEHGFQKRRCNFPRNQCEPPKLVPVAKLGLSRCRMALRPPVSWLILSKSRLPSNLLVFLITSEKCGVIEPFRGSGQREHLAATALVFRLHLPFHSA
jgi:hypothetical protein